MMFYTNKHGQEHH